MRVFHRNESCLFYLFPSTIKEGQWREDGYKLVTLISQFYRTLLYCFTQIHESEKQIIGIEFVNRPGFSTVRRVLREKPPLRNHPQHCHRPVTYVTRCSTARNCWDFTRRGSTSRKGPTCAIFAAILLPPPQIWPSTPATTQEKRGSDALTAISR